ncbi:MFS transporter [candidate division WOR-3 bacterium]|uniref:MFS transporter n=1 Tax=candidate division WOR-3 bacterium TaxID=2052148 RepID=A0A9D5QCF8_UNCW3|nr:MFS transporter [candidate division WOR-3 bacterium]MBD3364514.1 MFS transporter [candidate division WOR-3 bacterium]
MRIGFSEYWGVAKKKNMALLSAATMVSRFGDQFTLLALLELIEKLNPGSFGIFGNSALFNTTPPILFGIIAGVLIDRWSKKTTVLVADAARALLVLAIPILVALTGSIWSCFGIIFLISTFTLLFNAARMTIIPMVVDKDKLLQGNSISTAMLRVGMIAGAVAGWFVIKYHGWELAIYIDAATYGLSFLLILFMSLGEKKRESTTQVIDQAKDKFKKTLSDTWQGIKTMSSNRMMVFVVISLFVMFSISAVAYSVIIPVIQQTLNMGTEGVVEMGAIAAIGMLLGSVLVGLVGKGIDRRYFIVGGYLLIGISFGVGVLFINIWVMRALMMVAGLVFGVIGVAHDTILHNKVPADIRGRVFSNKELINSVPFLIIAFVGGHLADILSYQAVLLGTGGIISAFSLVWLGFLIREKSRDNKP